MTRKHAFPALIVVLAAGCAPFAGVPPPYPSGPASRQGPPRPEQARLEEARRLLGDNRLEAADRALDGLLDDLILRGGTRGPEGNGLVGGCLDTKALLDVLFRIRTEPSLWDRSGGWWHAEDFLRPEVRAWRRRLLADGGRGLRRWVRQAAPYYPDILAAIREHGLPDELWVLTLVESGFRLGAVSRAKAVGPWQFMMNTARHCGLLVTTDRDERRDWVAATHAACRYLGELKNELGDGLLALAAFNCGPSRVRRELASSSSRSFWGLAVPPETRRYVPYALALVDLLGDGGRRRFDVDADEGLDYEELAIPYTVEVEHLAKACGTSVKDLRRMNPAWLLPITPADGRPVRARIPPGTGDSVAERFQARTIPRIKVSPGRMYEIRRGDTLWGISRRFRVSLRTLLKVNGLTGKEVIHPGREIRLPG